LPVAFWPHRRQAFPKFLRVQQVSDNFDKNLIEESFTMSWFRTINRKFFAGLLAVLPILATLYLFYWGVTAIEGGLGAILGVFLPEGAYRPGLGLAAGVVIIFLVGALVETFMVRNLLVKVEELILKIPMVKIVYGATRDLLSFISRGKERGGGETVWVSLGVGELVLLGFVTGDDLSDFGEDFDEMITVYLPFSYQIGGYTVVVPRRRVVPAGIPFEKAMRFVMTAGVMESKAHRSRVKAAMEKI
jgi:uncharacterized membrane protein